MPPVRLKVNGLFTMTKRTYLFIQGFGFVLMLTAMAVIRNWPRPQITANQTPLQVWLLKLFDWLPTVILIGLLIEALEVVFMLRRFAFKQAEADRQEQLVSTSSSKVP